MIASPTEIRDLYTHRALFYHLICVHLLGWGRILKNCFAKSAGFVGSGLKVLDAGCGTGAATRAFFTVARRQNETDLTFHAFDLTPAMLAIFKMWHKKHPSVSLAIRLSNVLDLKNNLPKNWNDYDRIISSGMLEHLPKSEFVKALSNFKKMLKPGGRILVVISRQGCFPQFLYRYLERRWKTNNYTENELQRIFSAAGFASVKTAVVGFGWLIVVEAKA